MDPLHQPLSDIVCKQLKQFIEEGRWQNTLPGINRLCEELQVSRQTMMLALRQLELESYVKEPSPGKAREIHSETTRVAVKSTASPVIGFISRVSMAQIGTVPKEVYDLIGTKCEQARYQLKKIIFNEIESPAGAQKLEEVLSQNKADLYIVHSTHRACSIKLRELGIPVIHLGGEQVKRCTPRIAFSLIDMCSQAIDYLKSNGHQRIVYFLPEAFNRRDETIDEHTLKKLSALFSLHQLPFSSYNCPYWGRTKESFELALKQAFKVTPPTAIIVSKASHVPRVISFLMNHNLKFPDDVSLIALDESSHLEDFDPPISYLKKSSHKMVDLILSEMNKILGGVTKETSELLIAPTELVATDSVKDIRPRKKT